MACIVFGIADSISHYNASFRIAGELKKKGHRIIFISDSDQHVNEVKAQGFECEIIYHNFYQKAKQIKKPGKRWNSYLNKKIRQLNTLREFKNEVLSGNQIRLIVEKYSPDLFILDIFHVFHYATIYEFKVKTIILQTYVNTSKNRNVPPLNAGIIPKETWTSRITIELLWLKLFAMRYVLNLWSKLQCFGMDKLSLFKDVARKNKLAINRIDLSRSFHWGIKGIPELILAAREFDFNRSINENQYYVGPAVAMERREVLYDDRYLEVTLQRELVEIEDENKLKPIVYCSLGTLNTDWSTHCKKFFEKVIEVFRERDDYELYLSIGPDMSPGDFEDVPDNVYIFKLVPQLDILEKASLMITHGGINSINECIMAGVPMIVYPLSSNIDQHGNAARVVYHELGVRGNIKTEEVAGIKNKINHLLNTDEYKVNVEKMKAVYQNYHEESKFMEVIDSYLEKP